MSKQPRVTPEYQKQYRKQHPEQMKRYRLTSYINAIRRAGYTVIPPTESDKPADNQRRNAQ